MLCAWLAAAPAGTPGTSVPVFPYLWAILPLVGAILLAAAIVALVKQWRRRPGPDPLSTSDQLARFRSLYEAGDLSAEEFARIRARLGAQLKQELEIPPGTEKRAGEPTSPGDEPDTSIRPGPPGAP